MSWNEIEYSLIIGVISGIISSIIVTQLYRIKDRERDRTLFFERFKDFYSKLYSLLSSLMFPNEEVFLEFKNIHPPRKYRWINLKKEEASIIYKIDEIYYGLAPKIREMSNEYQKTKDEYILMEVWSQYAEDFGVMYKQMVELGDKVWDLAYPEGKKYRKIANKKKK